MTVKFRINGVNWSDLLYFEISVSIEMTLLEYIGCQIMTLFQNIGLKKKESVSANDLIKENII